MNYGKHISQKTTPQSEPIPGRKQVKNAAGGFGFEVDNWTRLDRFLILGNEGGTYYATERKLTTENAACVELCLLKDYKRAIDRIVEISLSGRAAKNDPAIFALAIAASTVDKSVSPTEGTVADIRRYAMDHLSDVCRIGTHLFQFIDTIQELRPGWRRTLRRGVAEWYENRSKTRPSGNEQLSYQLVKYRQRNDWTHRDVLRLSHAIRATDARIQFAVGKPLTTEPNDILRGFQLIQEAMDEKAVVKVLEAYPQLPWETIPTEHLKSTKVWETLLPNLPLTALVRNLGRLTANNVIKPLADSIKLVREKLLNEEALGKARVHPIAILAALVAYKNGKGERGKTTWTPVPAVNDILDEAFYLAFRTIVPTGKRTLLALDISGSMEWGTIAGIPGLLPREASAAMAMVTMRKESNFAVVGFSDSLIPLDISPRQRLDAVVKKISGLPFGGTDASLPILWAEKNSIQVDTFICYTDNETWMGRIHPSQALARYRQKTGIPAKMVTVAFTATNSSIGDPGDAGMLDVVGFDTAAPELIASFSRG